MQFPFVLVCDLIQEDKFERAEELTEEAKHALRVAHSKAQVCSHVFGTSTIHDIHAGVMASA